jgi:hypothetical protein
MWRDERGTALLLVLLCATLFLALGGALVTVASTESTISATFREGTAALAGAEAAVIRAFADIAAVPDLNAILAGSVKSTFSDGAAAPRLPDGTTLDVAAVTNVERCGMSTCTDEEMNAVTVERPWGVNNPRWQLYASGWLRDIAGLPVEAPNIYVVVWIGDDPLETDGDALTDAPETLAPGHDVVLLRAAAYGAYSVRRRIEVVGRRRGGAMRIASWRELR